MRIHVSDTLAQPLADVWCVLRDRLPDLVSYLPGIASIQTLQRNEIAPGQLYLVNQWEAERRAAPTVARPFLSSDLLRWKDHATWDEKRRVVAWRFEPDRFGGVFTCAGENRYTNDDRGAGRGATRLEISGRLEIHPERVPGVPRILARRIGPAIERFLLDRVQDNLEALIRGVRQYLGAV